eukprot:2245116-Rhodomonas_salina.1
MSACIETATSQGNLTAFASGLQLVSFKVRKAVCMCVLAELAGLIGQQRLLLSPLHTLDPRPSTRNLILCCNLDQQVSNGRPDLEIFQL